MKDYIVFTVASNRYALDIETIQRIIQVPDITPIPNAHFYIDGMLSYEGNVLRVLNFRKMIGMPGYDEELHKKFENLKQDHKVWIETLTQAMVEDTSFELTTNPHHCNLGKWIDRFIAHDDSIAEHLAVLKKHHGALHAFGETLLEVHTHDKARALILLEDEMNKRYQRTMALLDRFSDMVCLIAASLQKLLIYTDGDTVAAIKVDSIEDIRSIDDMSIRNGHYENLPARNIVMKGVVDIDGKLINIIESIGLPANEVK